MAKSAEVKVLESGGEARWDKFVASHRFGTIYHTSLWKKIVEDSYEHSPLYLYREDQKGNIEFGLPLFEIRSVLTGNRLACLPCAQECNPLVSNQAEIDVLIEHAKELKSQRNCASIELKTSEDFPFVPAGFRPSYGEFCTYVLDLGPELDEIKKTFHKNITRVIKKLPKNDLIVEDDVSSQAVVRFYRLYLKMRLEKGLLPQPMKFFVCLWNTLAPVRCVKILHARHEGKVISSIMILNYHGKVTYEYGASMSGKIHLHPSHLLLINAIEAAKAGGCRTFDFGRTRLDNLGLATFKQRWGAKSKTLVYYTERDEKNLSVREKSGYKSLMGFAVRKLPVWATQLCGRVLYRHVV
jgi:serine/alanine adding enzyme